MPNCVVVFKASETQSAIAEQLLQMVKEVVLDDDVYLRVAMDGGLVRALTDVISLIWRGDVVRPVCKALTRALTMSQW